MRRTAPLLAALFMLPLLLAAPRATAQDDAEAARKDKWMVRVARMEGASVNVEEAAGALQLTAQGIADGGRLKALSALKADAAQLDRRIISARLAAEVLDDLD
jgi:hypothetical protein